MKAGAIAAIDGDAPDAAKQIMQATERRRLGGDRSRRLGAHRAARARQPDQGRQASIVVGLFGGDVTVPTPYLPLRAMTIQGSYVGSLTEMAELLDLVQPHRHARPCRSARARSQTVNDALNDLRAGKVVGRVVLTPA